LPEASEGVQAAAAPLAQARQSWIPSPTRIASVAVSVLLLVTLYRSISFSTVVDTLRHADTFWLIASVGMIVPITLLRAVRFRLVAPPAALSGIGEALRLTLVSTALNVFVPAKAGDLIKSYFIATRGGASAGVAVAIIVYERLCDMFAIIFWCVMGWVAGETVVARVPSALWPLLGVTGVAFGVLISSEYAADLWRAAMHRGGQAGRLRKLRELAEGWPDLLHHLRGRRRIVILFSMFLWLVHLTQIWMFTLALAVRVPFLVCLSLSAIVLIAGQMPLTIAGLGARDVALVVLLADYMAPEVAAAMGILIATRGLLPPVAAIPIMRPYLEAMTTEARTWRAGARRA
jgi:uncharacterized protein (TIRG00374 family)